MVDPAIPPIPGAACLLGAPGVYRFRDQAGRVLYVGRAVSLGGQKVRAAVSGLGRVLPLAYAADGQAGTERDMARVRGASPRARADLPGPVATRVGTLRPPQCGVGGPDQGFPSRNLCWVKLYQLPESSRMIASTP